MRYPPLYPHEVLGGVSHSCNIQARPSLPPLFFFNQVSLTFSFISKKKFPRSSCPRSLRVRRELLRHTVSSNRHENRLLTLWLSLQDMCNDVLMWTSARPLLYQTRITGLFPTTPIPTYHPHYALSSVSGVTLTGPG